MAKRIVLDANILIRAVLGNRLEPILQSYANDVTFLTVEEAFEDGETYVARVTRQKGGSEEAVAEALKKLSALRRFVQIVPLENIAHLETTARKRLKGRDEDDWPYLALALLLDCPVWTEDTDLFGSGVAVWTSDRILLFLEGGKDDA
jgi:predicted nucleic acid-binding protein